MIDRYCFVKLRDEHVAARDALAAALRAMLGGAGEMVTVGVPADDSAARWDLSLVVRTRDLAAWRALEQDPRVRDIFDVWLPARGAVIKAWTFAVE